MDFSFRIGLKLYSTNTDLIPEALLLKNKYFNYIELYIIPGSYDETISAWNKFDVPYVIHAPHSFHGVNLARSECRGTNMHHVREVQGFADALDADVIIVHGGNNGNITETIEQLRLIDDSRVVVENKPSIGILNESCIGWSASEFKQFREAGVLHGIALDFTHAACAARTAETDIVRFIQSLLEFEPKIFHISDSESYSQKDMHLNLGKGSLNLEQFLSFIPGNGLVTVETPRIIAENLSEFATDVNYLRNLSSNKG
jgi:sugar phosphate isomerase/epimerase